MVIITEKTLKKLVKEFLITIGFLSIATVIGMLLIYIGFTESNVTMVYLLCVLLISIFTNGYIWSVAGSLVSVVLMNFFLTEPRFTFHAYDTGYPLTCVIMLAASMLTGTLASKLKKHVRMSEQAAYREKTLQLRANLLRTISHDLRTPLTSISGNANNLMYNYDKLDNDTREQIFTDIYDDSEWLISLVENILFVTRFEDGTVTLNMSDQLIDEVIAEALKHINRKSCEHKIHVDCGKELLLVRMDVRLIIQVIINIVDNKFITILILICSLYLLYGFKEYYKISLFAAVASICVSSLTENINVLIFLRIIYVIAGVILVLIANKIIFPYRLKDGVRQLVKKIRRYNEYLMEDSKDYLNNNKNINNIRDVIIHLMLLMQKLNLRNMQYGDEGINRFIEMNNYYLIKISYETLFCFHSNRKNKYNIIKAYGEFNKSNMIFNG